MTEGFIPAHGGYKNLLSYQKAEIVFDATVFFCSRFYKHDRRMTDQMVQAARSGKQNIVEGSMASGTSKEMEIKLTNVARASLEELLTDYQDFLRIRRLPLWDKNHKNAIAIRKLGYGTNMSYQTYMSYIETESPDTAANSIICLIHQANYLLDQQIRRLERDFIEKGGLREKMTQARLRYREAKKPFQSSEPLESPSMPKNPIETNTLTAKEYIALRIDAGWGSPSEADALAAIKGSLVVFVKRIDGKAIGTIRIVGDGRLCFYIQDLMVLRNERQKGIATRLMHSAMEYIDRHAANNAFIGLMAAKGVEKLYEKFGFIIRPNETQGPGMIKFQGRPGETSET